MLLLLLPAFLPNMNIHFIFPKMANINRENEFWRKINLISFTQTFFSFGGKKCVKHLFVCVCVHRNKHEPKNRRVIGLKFIGKWCTWTHLHTHSISPASTTWYECLPGAMSSFLTDVRNAASHRIENGKRIKLKYIHIHTPSAHDSRW